MWRQTISDSKGCTFDLNESPEVVYYIGNCVLPVVQEVVDLRVTMDNGLKFSKHIAKLAVKGH